MFYKKRHTFFLENILLSFKKLPDFRATAARSWGILYEFLQTSEAKNTQKVSK